MNDKNYDWNHSVPVDPLESMTESLSSAVAGIIPFSLSEPLSNQYHTRVIEPRIKKLEELSFDISPKLYLR